MDYDEARMHAIRSQGLQEHDIPSDDRVMRLMQELAHYANGGAVHHATNTPVSYDDMLAHIMLHKADGGSIRRPTEMGVDEASNSDVKWYMPPDAGAEGMPAGGIDMQKGEEGQQFAPQAPMPAGAAPQAMPNGPQAMPNGPQAMPNGIAGNPQAAPPGPPSNILTSTPQGRAMSAMKAPQMKDGGAVVPNIAAMKQALMRYAKENQ